MNKVRCVRSNGSWFVVDKRGSQKIPEFFKTLEEARTAAEEYVQKLEIVEPIKPVKRVLRIKK
jgi:hypothetical protein